MTAHSAVITTIFIFMMEKVLTVSFLQITPIPVLMRKKIARQQILT